MSGYWHYAPKGKAHWTPGLAVLTACGLHPSRKAGWTVDVKPGKRELCATCRREFGKEN